VPQEPPQQVVGLDVEMGLLEYRLNDQNLIQWYHYYFVKWFCFPLMPLMWVQVGRLVMVVDET
jgi:hypothetical protein